MPKQIPISQAPAASEPLQPDWKSLRLLLINDTAYQEMTQSIPDRLPVFRLEQLAAMESDQWELVMVNWNAITAAVSAEFKPTEEDLSRWNQWLQGCHLPLTIDPETGMMSHDHEPHTD